jgi:hypothetical protein
MRVLNRKLNQVGRPYTEDKQLPLSSPPLKSGLLMVHNHMDNLGQSLQIRSGKAMTQALCHYLASQLPLHQKHGCQSESPQHGIFKEDFWVIFV